MKQSYRLNYKIVGKGPVVVMLHGLAGTSQYFDRITKYLPDHQIVSIDLLGFGKSPKPKNIQYTVEDHVDAIASTLENINIKTPYVMLGISMGALLALEYAKKYPKYISKIILVSPTIYSSPVVAKKKIDETRAPNILMFGPVAKFACKNICSRQKLAQKINPVVMRHIPKDVAKTVCEHSWESYSRSMQNIVINQPKQDITNISDIPLYIIYDKKDNLIEQDLIQDIARHSRRAEIVHVDGGHGMLVNNTSLVAEPLNRLL
jgi:pimeloyl-ACP methyl ester carboxylesterase